MFQKNLEYLKKKFPDLYTAVTNINQDSGLEIEVQQSKKGLPVARVSRNERRLYLNSPYDPETEARRWAERYANGEIRCALLYGAGFFYHLKFLLELDCFQKIAVYEPDLRILKTCLEYIDIKPYLESSKIFFITGVNYNDITNKVLGFLQNDLINSDGKLEVLITSSYRELYPRELEQFQINFRELLQVTQVNMRTLNVKGKSWLENAFKLLNSAVSSPAIRHYFGQFKNIPAIIVSAGPSLEKNIQLLNDLKEKAVILCAGSSIRAMKRFQVDPHFLVSFDYGEICNKVYGDLDLTGIDLIYSIRFWHKIVNKFPGKKILMKLDAEFLPKIIIEDNGGYEIGMVASGFSISHVCLDLAFKLGCNPIILIGQDLAYTSEKRYADGQLESSQKYLQSKQLPPNCFITKDINGADIVTDKVLDSFRIIFEKSIESYYEGKVTIVNATEGGVPIQGVPNRKLMEVISKFCREDRGITKKIAAIYEQGLKELEKHRIDPVKYCIKLKMIMERAVLKLAELSEKLQVIRRLNFDSDSFNSSQFEQDLGKIASEYDQTLNYHEYHAFLRELQATTLSINKIRLEEYRNVKTKEDFDQKILVYLNIIVETKNHLDFIITCINDYLEMQGLNQTQVVNEEIDHAYLNLLEAKIKAGTELPEIQKELQSGLSKSGNGARGWYLYLLGRLAIKSGRKDQAVKYLEQAVLTDKNMAKAYFQLFKLYHAGKDYINALKVLEQCRRLKYKLKYCLDMQIKANYATKNYVAANNLIQEYILEYSSNKWFEFLKVDCLQKLNLFYEVSDTYQKLLSLFKVSSRIKSNFADLDKKNVSTIYEETYQKNQRFFRTKGIVLPDYTKVRYKICRYLTAEFVYDHNSGKLMSLVNQVPQNRMSIDEADVIAIYNPSDTKIFERLAEVINQADSRNKELFGLIPVYVIERDTEQWQLIIQLFDFESLETWTNLHFYIASSNEELEKIFADEKIPFPNMLHGTSLPEFEQMITKVKTEKEQCYQQRLNELHDYYQTFQVKSPQKVLVVSSRKDHILLHYGQKLHDYLSSQGINSYLHLEPLSYHQFTYYEDARLLNEFRPDLVIHLFGVQEELAVYQELNIPFVSWLLIEKQFPAELKPVCPNQKIIYTGNLDSIKQLVQKGFPEDKISSFPLPVFDLEVSSSGNELVADGIGIIGELGILEKILANLETIIHGLAISNTWKLNRQNIQDILKAVYFWVRANHSNDDLTGYQLEEYQKMLSECFGRYNLTFGQHEFHWLSTLIKREFEDYFFKRLQTEWIIEEFKSYKIRIYGNGWQEDAQFKPFWKGALNPLTDFEQFKNEVLQNKVNILLDCRINNKSYLQPDLIYGMTIGGFFLVNDLLVKQFGKEILKPFGGFLETHGTKRELFNKLKYFIENDNARIIYAKKLQEFVAKEFELNGLVSRIF